MNNSPDKNYNLPPVMEHVVNNSPDKNYDFGANKAHTSKIEPIPLMPDVNKMHHQTTIELCSYDVDPDTGYYVVLASKKCDVSLLPSFLCPKMIPFKTALLTISRTNQ